MANETNNELEKVVNNYRRRVTAGLKKNAASLSKGKRGMVTRGQKTGMIRTELKLQDSIGSKVLKRGGEIEAVSFPFERHGVFVTRGVSRKHPVTNPRDATDWISPVLEKNTPELADQITEINANNVIKLKQ
jgi:hypothetical protein